LEQHGVPVKIKELLLSGSETANIDGVFSVDAHSLQREAMSDRRYDQPAIVLETNETAIK